MAVAHPHTIRISTGFQPEGSRVSARRPNVFRVFNSSAKGGKLESMNGISTPAAILDDDAMPQNVRGTITSINSAKPLDVFAVLRKRRTAWKVAELAALLSLGKRTLYTAFESGQLPAMRFGGSVRLSPADVLAWAEARTTGIRRAA